MGIGRAVKKALKKVMPKKLANFTSEYLGVVTGGILSPSDKVSNTVSKVLIGAGLAGGAGYLAGGLLGGGAGGAASAAGAASTAGGGAGAGAGGTMGNFLSSPLAGGLASAAGSVYSAEQAKKAAEKATAAQVAWERERATHAHQWEVQDLLQAGLNPILSAGGSGAMTGGISAPVPDTSGYGQAIPNMINSMLTAEQAKNAEVERQNIIEDTNLKGAEIISKMANADLFKAKEKESIANTAESYAKTMLHDQQYKQQEQMFQKQLDLIEKQIKAAQLQNDQTKVNTLLKEYENKMKKYTWWLGQANEAGRTGAALMMGASSAGSALAKIIPAGRAIGFLAR